MTLHDWLASRWLAEHKTSPAEIGDLFTAIRRDLVDCRAEGLSPDWRLSIAYTAALRAATAALAASGYRPGREQQHYRVIHSLAFTVGIEPELIMELDLFRKKRNISAYERVGTVSDFEADRMIELAELLQDRVRDWLAENHPGLLW